MNTPSLQELRRQNARRHTKSPLWRRLLLPAAVLAVLLLLGAWLLAPILARAPLERRLSAALQRPVTIERLRINPLALSVSIEKLQITDPDRQVLVSWDNLYANLNFFPLLRGTLSFSDLSLTRFQGDLRVSADGQLNIADLLAPAPSANPSPSPRIHIARLQINNSTLRYTDASAPFETQIGPTSLTLTDLHTADDRHAPGTLSATTESGETLAWRGQLSLAPLSSDGELSLTKLSLPKYQPYHAALHQLTLVDGQLDLKLNYRFALENNLPVLRLTPSTVQLRNLKLTSRSPAALPLVELNQLDLGIAAAVLPLGANPSVAPSLALENLNLTGGQLRFTQSASGLDLLQLLRPANPHSVPNSQLQTPNSPVPALAAPPVLTLKTLTVRQLAFTLTDTTPARPATHVLTAFNLDLQNLDLANLASPLPLILETRLADSGLLRAQGTVALAPLSADLTLEITTLPLAPLSPYLETSAPFRLTSGALSSTARLKLSAPGPDSPLQLSAQADLSLDAFALTDLTHSEELLRLNQLQLHHLDYTSAPARLSIATIDIRNPVINYTLHPAAESSPTPPPPTQESKIKNQESPAALFIALDLVNLTDASFTFTDRTLTPIPQLTLNQFSGTITGLSSLEVSRAEVALRGQVTDTAPLLVTGTINPLAPQAYTDLKIDLAPANLANLSPYVSKFAGYALAQGSASLRQTIRLENRRLDTKNVLTLSPFTLGPRTPGPDATSLPIPFALALLRDTQGRIVIDLPVSGRLDDPSFKISKVVIRVITNLLVKAVSSPFSLLASALGSNSASKPEDLAQQTFAFGSYQLNEYSTRHLDALARALRERPGLTLQITGGYDPLNDAPALREAELNRRLQSSYKEEYLRLNRGQKDIPPDFAPTPEQTQRLLAQYFREAYLPEEARVTALADQVTQGNAANAKNVSKSPPPSKRPWIIRIFRGGAKPAASGLNLLPPNPAELAAALTPLPPPDEVRLRVLEALPVETPDLETLAQARAQAVQTYLATQGQIDLARLPFAAKPLAKAPRATLELK